MHDTLKFLRPSRFPAITRHSVETLQINIGLRCNLACLHCHVDSNPYRKEKMSPEIIKQVIEFLMRKKVKLLDITGGAPEIHPQFCELITAARKLNVHVIDRCNLTILEEVGYESMAEFLVDQEVEIVASLPCYTEDNVDQQRGKGVFKSSIAALQRLNKLGYGRPGTDLILNLVYNPIGPFLPPAQEQLEITYKQRLYQDHGIEFNKLYTLCNMPIKRFGSTLVSKGQFHNYMTLLKQSHREKNLENLMCRSLVSVDWQGYLYDCDFNQILNLNISDKAGKNLQLSDLLNDDLAGHPIAVAEHCYGCTASQGSSCSGALS